MSYLFVFRGNLSNYHISGYGYGWGHILRNNLYWFYAGKNWLNSAIPFQFPQLNSSTKGHLDDWGPSHKRNVEQASCLCASPMSSTSHKQPFITSPLTNTMPFKIIPTHRPTHYLSEWPESMARERVPVSKRCSGKVCVQLSLAAIQSPPVAQQGG